MLKHASLDRSKSSSQYYDSVASWKPRQRPYDPKAGVPSLMVMPQLVQICSSYKGGDWGPMVSLAIGPLTLSLLWLKSNTGTQITSHGGAALCYSSVQCQRAAILLCQNKRLCLCLSLCNCQCLYVVCNFKTESRAVWKKRHTSPSSEALQTPSRATRTCHIVAVTLPFFDNHILSCSHKQNLLASAQLTEDVFFVKIKGTAPPNQRHWTLLIYKNCWTFFMYIAQEVCFQRLDLKFGAINISSMCSVMLFFSLSDKHSRGLEAGWRAFIKFTLSVLIQVQSSCYMDGILRHQHFLF